ncbi:NAD(P)H-hydrate dehydratase [Crocinitomicaceae bacterium]|nr:NAD(P)H-hydrate dehydratase [Crocinitomicaceae bacterium]
MKILTAQQIRECDAYTIANEPIPSIDLMERASAAFVDTFLKNFSSLEKRASIFCGTGNNGGDGFVIARLLHEKGWEVNCFLIPFSEKVSPDNRTNQNRLRELGINIQRIENASEFPSHLHPIIIDALVGTGISRPLEGLLSEVVVKINQTSRLVCSVDLPSGLYERGNCSEHLDRIIHANFTFTFQSPKLNFLFPEYANVVGQWDVLDIGLDAGFIASLTTQEFLIDKNTIQSLLKPRSAHSHKGTYGHAGLICGSKGMMGAAVLATSACLRSGAGLTTIMVPEVGYSILQSTCPEAMYLTIGNDHINAVPDMKKYSSIGVGPGIGQNISTKHVLLDVVRNANVPMVIDADALNLLSESDLTQLPKGSVLTPHPKEFERLFGATRNSHEQLERLREKALNYKLIILLKGRHSSIALPDGNVYFNSSGNPGMAKGGSGDVLTGLLTGLIARGYSSENAALIGCYLHGLAGDLCAKDIGMEAMKALDLIDYLPKAFREN